VVVVREDDVVERDGQDERERCRNCIAVWLIRWIPRKYVRKVKSEIEERKKGTRFRGAGAMFKLIDFWSPGKAGCWNPRRDV
jgi:hypothetical protein